MLSKSKNWLSGGIWKPKNPHSLEHLKYLHNVLCKNQTVTEQNKGLLVEILRSISEILIWGDQNDSSVFDFFLEKNMLAFFLRFMKQKSGRFICIQLLQTLNILFENISNETSVYYLLSNNHINSIIVHKFDFSDEEVMAYYISFLKTLSLKLNKHTIHFFYNEHTNDFALYTEAIKFFNHPETMVRIAVRTITLNVYKACRYTSKLDEMGQPIVDDKCMLRYIRDKTAAPYFSNLVWFIGNHVLELDTCVRHDIDHNSRNRLADLVAEHLDHLHYLNDILGLDIDALNEVLTDHLLHRLLLPLYVYSLTKKPDYAPRSDTKPHVGSVVSLFLLSQVFLIMHHAPLVRQLTNIICNGNLGICLPDEENSPKARGAARICGFVKPTEPLAQTLEQNRTSDKPQRRPNYRNTDDEEGAGASTSGEEGAAAEGQEGGADGDLRSPGQNSTDEEKLMLSGTSMEQQQAEFSLQDRPYLECVFNALECSTSDYEALFSLCLLYALGHNTGINQELLDKVLMPTDKSETKAHYNILLIEKLIRIINLSCQNVSRIRLATLELCILLLRSLVHAEGSTCYLQDRHLASLEGAREEATLQLRNFYKSEEIFLDMFEDEYREMRSRPLNVEYLTMDASILLPPTGTPLTGIQFAKRLPCGEVERARRAIRVFFLLREMSLMLRRENELQLPLTKQEECVQLGDVLDLNNSDLIACTIISKDSSSSKRERRFLVMDILQLILVEPDGRRLGWGVVKFVGFLQDVEVAGDKEDSRSLHITIHKPAVNAHARPLPLLSARFIFDDHIRCMAAKQRLSKGRLKARQRKMQMIARLLELPTHIVESMYQAPSNAPSATALRKVAAPQSSSSHGRSHPGAAQRSEGPSRPQSEVLHRSVFASVEKVPGFSKAQQKSGGKRSQQLPSVSQGISRTGAMRGHPGGMARQSVETTAQDQTDGGVDKVEQAEEAKPSPDAHAMQTLHPPSPSPEARQSKQQSPDQDVGINEPVEIPMEELKSKQRVSSRQAEALALHKQRLSEQETGGAKVRSASYSPRRSSTGRRGSYSPATSTHHSHSPSPVRGRRRKDPGHERANSCSSFSSITSTGEVAEAMTSLTKDIDVCRPKNNTGSKKKSKIKGSRPKSADSLKAGARRKLKDDFDDAQKKSSATSSPSPKTLRPAQEPALSLITSFDLPSHSASIGIGSPKLVPPAEVTRLRSHSDASSLASSDTDSIDFCGSSASEFDKTPFTNTYSSAAVGETTAEVEGCQIQRAAASDVTAVSQLTKLAHIVQEQCSIMGEKQDPLSEAVADASLAKENGANVTDDIKEQVSTVVSPE